MRANERTDERVAQYLRLYSCLFQTTVGRMSIGGGTDLNTVGYGDAHAVDDSGKVSQIEDVMKLGRRRRKFGADFPAQDGEILKSESQRQLGGNLRAT